MSHIVTSQRNVTIQFTGGVQAANTFAAANNTASPGQIELRTLAAGPTTITPPTGGSTPKSCTIIPPEGNTNLITLKGIAGDTGVGLHKTDPTTIALDSPTNTFVLNAAAIITGVRLVWA
jgi:hypothetical protein